MEWKKKKCGMTDYGMTGQASANDVHKSVDEQTINSQQQRQMSPLDVGGAVQTSRYGYTNLSRPAGLNGTMAPMAPKHTQHHQGLKNK